MFLPELGEIIQIAWEVLPVYQLGFARPVAPSVEVLGPQDATRAMVTMVRR
jgi:hypothetical protein